jgi:hypothetical protein
MFIDVFDSVKTSLAYNDEHLSENNTIHSEISLYTLLLAGYTPALTSTQMTDSNTMYNLTSKHQSCFIKLLKDGYIKTVLFPGEFSLRSHFISCLSRGITDSNALYEFSIFPFLSSYNDIQRKEIQKKILASINNHYTNFHVPGLSAEHAEFIEAVYDNFQIVDILTKKTSCSIQKFKRNMSTLISSLCSEINNDLEFNELYSELCKDNNGLTIQTNQRSVYYNFIKRMHGHYSDKVIQILKAIIDNSYNICIASLVNDYEGSKITSAIKEVMDNTTMRTLSPSQELSMDITTVDSAKTSITWDDIVEILDEVKAIEQEKKLNRIDALKQYKRKQKLSNTFQITKYIVGNTLKTLIPGSNTINAIVNISSEVAVNSVTEVMDDKIKMFSISDLIHHVKKNNRKSKFIDHTLSKIRYHSLEYKKL